MKWEFRGQCENMEYLDMLFSGQLFHCKKQDHTTSGAFIRSDSPLETFKVKLDKALSNLI